MSLHQAFCEGQGQFGPTVRGIVSESVKDPHRCIPIGFITIFSRPCG